MALLFTPPPPPKKTPKQHTVYPTPYAAGVPVGRLVIEPSSQMQNRLDAAAEAQAASEKQLADVQSTIAAELAARPESVKFLFLPSSPGSLLTPDLLSIVRLLRPSRPHGCRIDAARR